MSNLKNKDIAVVGIACRLPGANDYDQFWNNLSNGINSIREIPPERWDINKYYSKDITEPNKSVSKWCGVVEKVNEFDNRFFYISPREASNMDPQQRLLLEETWHCIEDSGVHLDLLQQKKTSVYIGAMTVDYRQEALEYESETDSYACLGNYESILANRLSYIFGFQGVSSSINAACASSLVAIHQARHSLRVGESDYAFVGGVNLNLHPWKYISFSKSRMLSPEGQCKTFDKDANGYVPGDGVGVLLLQRLEDAIKEGRHIYGVIKGSAVNHGGKNLSITAPSIAAQKKVIQEAYSDAGFTPETVSYVEAHGTGTSLGDPIEVEALKQVFSEYTNNKHFCKIGSVKTNIGHLEAAAGIAGIIKVLMMMRYKKIPQTLNVKIINPILNLENSPFLLSSEYANWENGNSVNLRAGVSSFGFGGVNSHILLEEYRGEMKNISESKDSENHIFVLSAKTMPSLEKQLNNWKSFVKDEKFSSYTLRDICLTLLNGRKCFNYRYGNVIKSKDELVELINTPPEYIFKKIEQPWLLRVGETLWYGYDEVKKVSDHCYLYHENLKKVLDELREVGEEQALFKGFWKKSWDKSYHNLYSFIANYAFAITIVELGFSPSIVTGERLGVWVSLTLAGIVNLKDTLALLIGKKALKQIGFSRPNTAYLDTSTNQIFRPFYFDTEYVQELINGLKEETSQKYLESESLNFTKYHKSLVDYYVNKARLLITSQFTFKKYMEQWRELIKENIKIDIFNIIYNEKHEFDGDGNIYIEKVLLMVAIVSSLYKLNKKWNIKEQEFKQYPKFFELVDLIVDEVLPLEEFVFLLSNKEKDYARIASVLNEHQAKINLERPYHYLRESNFSIKELLDVSEWIENLTNNVPTLINEGSNMQILELGNLSNPTEEAVQYKWNKSEHPDKLMKQFFLRLWNKGINVKWHKLWNDVSYQTVNLPGYYFERKSFWHPKERVTEPSAFVVNSEQTIIRDHNITGEIIMPFALMVNATLNLIEQKHQIPVTLSNITAHNPVIIKSEKVTEIKVSIVKNKFELYLEQGLTFSGNYGPVKHKSFTRTDIQNSILKYSWDIVELYSELYKVGYRYGVSLRPIKKALETENEYLFELEDLSQSDQYNRGVNPILLDGIFQTLLMIECKEGRLSANSSHLYIPYIINFIDILGNLRDSCYVSIEKQEIKRKGNDLYVSMHVYDKSGNEILIINDMLFKKVPNHFLEKYNLVQDSNYPVKDLTYYQPTWVKQKLINSKQDRLDKIAIIFVNENEISKELSKQTFDKYQKVFFIKNSSKFLVKNNEFEINGGKESNYQQLIQRIVSEVGTQAVEYDVYHLWSYEKEFKLFSMQDGFYDQRDTGLQSLFFLTKALTKARIKQKINIITCTMESQVVEKNDVGNGYMYGGIAGLAKSVMVEHTNVNIKVVDYANDNQSEIDKAAILLMEMVSSNKDNLIAYRNFSRYIYKVECKCFEEKLQGTSFKNNHVYLITGGSGAIGLKVAKQITRQVNANIVLLGRTELNGEKLKYIESLKESGSEITYYQCNISDKVETKEIIEKIKKQYGHINGVIHAAGVLNDKLLINKDWKSFEEVIAPKVQGTCIINKLTQSEPLDFFVVFSSIVSIIGNFGQTDYATANSFLNAFIDYRKRNNYPGKSISIDWTLWTDGGMGNNPSVTKAFIQKSGVINSRLALFLFEHILEGEGNQYLIVGDPVVFEESLRKEGLIQKNMNTLNSKQKNKNKKDLESVQYALVKALAEILEVNPSELEFDIDIREYGLESISLSEFCDFINGKFKLSLNPTILFDYPKIEDLTNHIMKHLQNSLDLDIETGTVEEIKDTNISRVKTLNAPSNIQHLQPLLTEMLAKLLEVDINEIDKDTDLREFGLDSITLFEYVEQINKQWRIDINPTLLYQYTTIEEIAIYLQDVHSAKLNSYFPNMLKSASNPSDIVKLSIDHSGLENENTESINTLKDIAIIGISGRFPGSKNLLEFWRNLIEEKDLITEIPSDRWDWEGYIGDPLEEENKTNSKWGGFLEDIKSFDASFFKISPREAELMDPQQRILIEEVWHTIEDAGYKTSSISNTDTGIFIGVCNDDYNDLMLKNNLPWDAYTSTGSYFSIIPNRISYILNIHGPSIAIDTACSSSLVAIHQAISAIQNGDCSMAFAGGINICSSPRQYISFSNAGMLSEDGCCKTFDKSANGYVRGEGVGVILLKPLTKALEDGDQIYGVIKGSAVNHGGYANTLTAPNPNAQAELIVNAWERAKIDPTTVTYIETHGTGTRLGDPIEINGLKSALKQLYIKWGKSNPNQPYCGLGSLKTSIGHLESAAGIAGIIKVLLAMKYKKIPGNLHFNELNPHIEIENSPFFIVNKTMDWNKETEESNVPLRAAVSSFGFGGANAHIVLEEYTEFEDASVSEGEKQIFVLSAANEDRLKAYARNVLSYLEDNEKYEYRKPYAKEDQMKHISTADIAYTLQIGRDEMEERLAIVASNKKEFSEKLKRYIYNEEGILGVYKGNAQLNKTLLDNLLKGKAGEEFFKTILINRELDQLSYLWVLGFKFDWKQLYNSPVPKRVSLPTYPFKREQYWLPESNVKVSNFNDFKKDEIHPLVHKNTSTLLKTEFKTILNGNEFFLADHFVEKQKVLPGVAFMEAACIAAEVASEKKVLKLNNVIWTNPIVSDKPNKEIYIRLTPKQNELDYEITSKNQNGQNILQGQGKITLKNDSKIEGNVESIDINWIKERCCDVLLGTELYPRLDTLGLSLGKSFRAIQELQYNRTEALSFLSLPSHLLKDYSQFKLHPAIMDAALQTALGLLNQNNELEILKIPFSIGEVQILGDIPEYCYSYVIRDESNVLKQSVNRFTVYVLDIEGQVRIKIKDFVVRPMQRSHSTANNIIMDESTITYFKAIWENHNIGKVINKDISDNILLFDKSVHLYNEIIKKMTEENKNKVILVRPGDTYRKLDNLFEINPNSKEDYNRLVDDLVKYNLLPGKIIHSWSDHPFIQSSKYVNQQLAEGVFSLFYLSQALNKVNLKQKIQIIYAFNSHNDQQPLYAAVSGFAKTLRLEYPKVQLKTVGFHDSSDGITITKLASILLQELFMEEENILEVRYEENERLVKQLKETTIETNNNFNLFNDDGVYLITGGAGGLGLIIAKYLAQKTKAKIVLCGRSELDLEKKANIEKIQELGSDISYNKCDISKYDEVRNLITEVKSKFNKINGVIHCAGIIRDSLIYNKKISEVKDVLAPKVLGTINLDNVLKEEKLDFFVLFSSITALFGNIGQSDYAYANSFLDNFASFREYKRIKKERWGKTIAINWPYWSEGGMKMDSDTQEMLDSTMGLKSMATETGLHAFNKAIISKENQLVVIEGDQTKIQQILELPVKLSTKITEPKFDFKIEEEILNQSEKPAKNDAHVAPETGGNGINSDVLLKKIQHDLVKQVSTLLKMNYKNIDLKKDFNNYGFDSISFIKLSNGLNKMYSLDLTPVSFFEYPNLYLFSLYLLETYGYKFANYYHKSLEHEIVTAETVNYSDKEKNPDLDEKYGEINEVKPIETTMLKEPIAIVGINGIMPQSENLEDFWVNLIKGKDLISEIPEDRWDWKDYYGDPLKEDNKTNVISGGFIKDANKFDANFFNIPPIEAEFMDPQQRIFLQTVWKTIEDAGYQASQLSGTKTGLFVGVSTSDYLELLKENNVDIKAYTTTGSFHSILANRISYLLNLRGPSVPVDTACSSSLVALRQAMEAIWSKSCEMAIVGGVNLMFTPTIFISFSKAGMLSADGKCKTFDKDANGYVRAEGAGAILLKPLSKAVADKDHIYAVVRGCTINHGGRVNSLTTPNPNAQAELIANTLEDAQIDPSTINYIEMHGTGTALGDPIEINGLKKAFQDLYNRKGELAPQKPYCGIGSVKSNIGHLEAGAGIAGLLKVILSMKYKKIPGNIHLKEINPYIKLEDSPFYIVKDTIDWNRLQDKNNNDIPRRAGVSSFGFGGVNAHVILEEYIDSSLDGVVEDLDPQIFILSAKSEERLKEYAKQMYTYLKKSNHQNLKEICYTLQTGREAMEERLALVVSSVEELIEKLKKYYLTNDETNIYRKHVSMGKTSHSLKENGEYELTTSYLNFEELNRIAKLWVLGSEVKWDILYGGHIPKKVSLPTYPFEKKKYWMQNSIEINSKRNENPLINNEIGNYENKEQYPANPNTNNLNDVKGNKETGQDLELDNLFYIPEWIPKDLSAEKIKDNSFLNSKRKKVLVVYSYQNLEMKDILEIIHQNDDFVLLDLNTIDPKGWDEWIKKTGNLDIVYFLGGILNESIGSNDVEALESTQKQGVISLFRLIKSLIKFGYDHHSLKLKAFTNDVHEIIPGDLIKPYAASINGLIKSTSKECPNWEVSCIDICTKDIENIKRNNEILKEHVLDELIDPSGVEVAIRGTKRYIRKIRSIILPEVKSAPFRNKGVYLILGGAGGIGLELSQYLASAVQAKLVLIGRNELKPWQKEKIKKIESLGGTVKFIQADALDVVSMSKAVRKAESEFGEINGVIHSAIVLNDKTLRNMDEVTFRSTLDPKVQGSVILHHVLEGKTLDFMMFFSSVQSFIGNEGQSNYAAACTFKDAYASYLNQKESYPVKTINWGYWGSVGIVASKEYQKLMEAKGIYSIEPREGIEAIQRIISNNSQQIIPIKAESQALERMEFDFSHQLELYPQRMPSIFEETISKLQIFS
ncbi:hypothetical protein CN558_22205 [Bacillus wiedmannii]|uniref:SDR family NAD(P)-dependent oxidoreductase n=1 Tax=Bacillus wiedmannii TaxID=1890302 RepID=UPI000BEFC59D|nr:SDR family NAD(P)-dependent oxidoreductase [Bacillus wiedmannii]PEO82731.1 hypothetical protein CN558_22205 [Bacillus wiedmannii]